MKNRTGLFMGTTDVPAERTAGEIMRLLGKAGATSIVMDYERGEVSGMRWKMTVDGREAIFSMPVRVGQSSRSFKNSGRHHSASSITRNAITLRPRAWRGGNCSGGSKRSLHSRRRGWSSRLKSSARTS